MTAELIFVGTEILLGDILNTNAQYLSKELAALGVGVLHQHVVGDNEQRLAQTIELALSRSDVVITTGGLGPTADDITKEVAADVLSVELAMHEESLEKITNYFRSKNFVMAESNKKQALMPVDGTVIPNTNGTAPGCIMEKNGKTIIVLPGPPREMKPMFLWVKENFFVPRCNCVIKSHNIRTFGIGESTMAETVSDLLEMSNPTVAPYAKSGEALLRVTAKAESDEKCEEIMAPVIKEINNRIGKFIYAVDADNIEQAVVSLLKERGITVAVAESCTGGMIAKRITDVPGSSSVFGCGIVSYSNETKMNVLGVKKQTLETYFPVSEQVAKEMAEGVRKLSGADIGISTTGIAGPDTDESGKEVGLIYIGISSEKGTRCRKLLTSQKGTDCRDYNRIVASSSAISEIRREVLDEC